MSNILKVLLFLFCMNSSNVLSITMDDSKQKLQSLWSTFLEGELDPVIFFQAVNALYPKELDAVDRMKLVAMENSFNLEKGHKASLNVSQLDENLISKLASEIGSLKQYYNLKMAADIQNQIVKKTQELDALRDVKVNRDHIKSLLKSNLGAASYNNGEYENTARLFLLCRENRSYPCRFVIKNLYGEFVQKNGKIWSMPALAKSKRNIPYNKTNGHTPMGVHRIDSVMPNTDRQTAFGKFRRAILNWVPRSQSESFTKSFLPATHASLTWWKQASVARDNGRLYLRIHGTGQRNGNRRSTYYPHVPTSGCISTLEGTYNGITFIDQREILDTLMKANNLAPVYSQEPRIKGILYVININNDKRAVSEKDLDDLIQL